MPLPTSTGDLGHGESWSSCFHDILGSYYAISRVLLPLGSLIMLEELLGTNKYDFLARGKNLGQTFPSYWKFSL